MIYHGLYVSHDLWTSSVSRYYNAQQRRCVGFSYGGCEGNANRFPSVEMCERQCGRYREQGESYWPAIEAKWVILASTLARWVILATTMQGESYWRLICKVSHCDATHSGKVGDTLPCTWKVKCSWGAWDQTDLCTEQWQVQLFGQTIKLRLMQYLWN